MISKLQLRIQFTKHRGLAYTGGWILFSLQSDRMFFNIIFPVHFKSVLSVNTYPPDSQIVVSWKSRKDLMFYLVFNTFKGSITFCSL